MNTKQYRYLLTIAQTGNLSQAAMTLGITQPALSQALAEWEKTFDCSLFLRHHRSLVPTPIGRIALEYAQKILDEQNRMVLNMRSAAGQERKRIRLCTAPNRAAIIYSHVYHDFSRRFPDIALKLVEQYASEQPGAVRRGTVDIALGAGPVSEDVADIPFAMEELLVALPASHPLAARKSVKLKELQDVPFVLQGKKHSIRSIAEELFEQAGFLPLIAFESNDVFLIDAMLHQAIGAGFVSKIHVSLCDDLCYLSLDPPVYQYTHIRYPLGHELTDAERYLAGLLMRHRLSDSRYVSVTSPEADSLLAETGDEEHTVPAAVVQNAGEQEAHEISLQPQVLKFLIAIEEEKSLTAAAESCYISQPALSRYLRDIEKMFGTVLFSREHNRLVPTNAGKIFINDARNILRYEAEMHKSIEAYRSGHTGHIFVQCDSILRPFFEKNCLPVFVKKYPEIPVEITVNSDDLIEEALLSANADIGIYLSRSSEHPDLDLTILGESELVYILSDELEQEPFSFSGCHSRQGQIIVRSGTALRSAQLELSEKYINPAPPVVSESDAALLPLLISSRCADIIMPINMLPPDAARRAHVFPETEKIYLILAMNPVCELPKMMNCLLSSIHDFFGGFFKNGQ